MRDPHKSFKLNSGAQQLSISMPGSLIELMDHFREQEDLDRSSFIKRAVKSYIASLDCKSPHYWEDLYRKLKSSTS